MNPGRRVRGIRQKSENLIFRLTYYGFLALGLGGLGYAGYVVADAHAYQATEQSRFESAITASHVKNADSAEVIGIALSGDAMGEMEIPRLGLKAIFVEGDSARVLRRAVGHIAGTASPGELGNVVLTGHRDTFFRPLRKIMPGDAITIKTLEGVFTYQVESTETVLPSDVRALGASSDSRLTLVTCFPFYYVGPAPRRFIVHARQIAPVEAQTATAARGASF